MLNPRVGLMLEMSSPLYFFNIVVLPALSRPSISSRTSRSFSFVFFRIVNRPIIRSYWECGFMKLGEGVG